MIKLYIVGGYVRDKLLGMNSNDIDFVVTGSNVDKMRNMGFTQVDSYFPIFLNDLHQEFALARDEDSFSPDTNIETDLYHRDFTINAMALDSDEKLIDPYGGKSDIENKIIRLVNPNAINKDPIRAIRAARFAARFDFKIDDVIFDEVSKIDKNKLCSDRYSERIWKEFSKVLYTDYFTKFIDNLILIGMDLKLGFNRTKPFDCDENTTPLLKYKRFADAHDTTNFISKLPSKFIKFSELNYDINSGISIYYFIKNSKNLLEIHDYIDRYDPDNSVLLRSIRDDFYKFDIDMSLDGKQRGLKLQSQQLEMIDVKLKRAQNRYLSNNVI